VQSLEEYIASTVNRVFPEQGGLSGQCVPLIGSNMGHIGSTICQQLARRLKRSPVDISRQLLPALAQDLQSEVVFDEGYVNFRFLSDEWRMLGLPEAKLPATHVIFLSPFVTTLSSMEFLRLSALASMQSLHLLSAGCTPVLLHEGRELQVETVEDALGFFSESLESVHNGRSGTCSTNQAAEQVLHCMQESGGPRTLWLAPRSLARKKYNELFKEYASSDTTFCCPPRSFLAATKQESLAPLLGAPGLAVLCYLCSDIPSSDIDPFVPGAREKANTVWFLNAVLERAGRIGLNAVSGSIFDLDIKLESLSVDQSELLILAAQQPRMCWLAATRGGVLECNAAQSLLLETCSATLNSPDIRLRLESDRISALERKIITSVLKSVSDIMLVWNG
jgi:hypothetical protein